MYATGIEHKWSSIFFTFREGVIHAMFYIEYKFLSLLLFSIIAIVVAIRRKKLIYASIALPGVMVYLLLDAYRLHHVPEWICYSLFNGAFLFCLYAYRSLFDKPEQRKLITLTGWFTLLFMLFTAMNLFIIRYLLLCIIPFTFLMAACFCRLIRDEHKAVSAGVIIMMIIFGGIAFRNSDGLGDFSLGTFDGISAQEAVIKYMEQHNAYDKNITAPSFLQLEHLRNYESGFLQSREHTFTRVQGEITPATQYVILDNVENYEQVRNQVQQDTSFKRIYQYKKGTAWAEIYINKHPIAP